MIVRNKADMKKVKEYLVETSLEELKDKIKEHLGRLESKKQLGLFLKFVGEDILKRGDLLNGN